jgi:hypothetical protein
VPLFEDDVVAFYLSPTFTFFFFWFGKLKRGDVDYIYLIYVVDLAQRLAKIVHALTVFLLTYFSCICCFIVDVSPQMKTGPCVDGE